MLQEVIMLMFEAFFASGRVNKQITQIADGVALDVLLPAALFIAEDLRKEVIIEWFDAPVYQLVEGLRFCVGDDISRAPAGTVMVHTAIHEATLGLVPLFEERLGRESCVYACCVIIHAWATTQARRVWN
jgi:hypothetical protein